MSKLKALYESMDCDECFGDAKAIISGFAEFYNGRRLHSAKAYRTPREAYQECK